MQEVRINQIEKMLKEQRKDEKVDCFMSYLEDEKVECILIGGAIRDAMSGRKPRDIDIIVDLQNTNCLEKLFVGEHINYTKNNFGGYKLCFRNSIFDIWQLKNHYSFKQKIYPIKIKNLKETTFLNYDSLIYNMKKKYLEVSYYDRCVSEKIIDLVGNQNVITNNPTPYMNIIKIMKTKRETDYVLSQSVKSYILKYYNEERDNFNNKIMKEYNRHYKKDMDQEFGEYISQMVRDLQAMK